jgi:hypothetical protein
MLEEHAPHWAVVASTIGVVTSAKIACIPGSINEAEVATGETQSNKGQ